MKETTCRTKLAGEIALIFQLRLAEALMPPGKSISRVRRIDAANRLETATEGARELVDYVLEGYEVRAIRDLPAEEAANPEGNR